MVDIEQIRKQWAQRGFSCDLWTDPPGQKWEDFAHAVDELFLLLEGEVELEIQNEVIHPSVGSEILIPAHSHHSVRNTGKKISRWLYGYKFSA